MAATGGVPSVHREVIEMRTQYETEWQAFRAAATGVVAMLIALVVTLLLVAVMTSGSDGPRPPSAPAGPIICVMDGRPVPCS